jgi:hypothetical protein
MMLACVLFLLAEQDVRRGGGVPKVLLIEFCNDYYYC